MTSEDSEQCDVIVFISNKIPQKLIFCCTLFIKSWLSAPRRRHVQHRRHIS